VKSVDDRFVVVVERNYYGRKCGGPQTVSATVELEKGRSKDKTIPDHLRSGFVDLGDLLLRLQHSTRRRAIVEKSHRSPVALQTVSEKDRRSRQRQGTGIETKTATEKSQERQRAIGAVASVEIVSGRI